MKKILSLILCVFLLLITANVLADDTLKITSGSILNGEVDAEVSVLLRYEFSEEIKDVTTEDVILSYVADESISKAVFSEVSASG